MRGSPAAPVRPKKSRPLLWMGCGALPVLLIGGVLLGGYAFLRFVKSKYAGMTAGGTGDGSAEVRYLRSWDEPLDPSGSTFRCFFGALVNTGAVPIRANVQFVFYDAANARVGDHRWSSSLKVLRPGETEPFSTCDFVSTTRLGTRYTHQIEIHSMTLRGEALPLEVSDLVTREVRPRHYEATGMVRNNSGIAMGRVQVVVSLLDAAGEIVGGGITSVAGGYGLGVGETARFQWNPQGAIEKARIEVRAVGYTDR